MKLFSRDILKSSLAITTRVGCRNHCTYCPQRVFIKAYRQRSDIMELSMDGFERSISTVPNNICLSFSGFCEPWLNPDCTDMVLKAAKKGHPVRVNTTLAGMSLHDIGELEPVPFIKFVVHLPDNMGLAHIKTDEEYKAVIKALIQSKIKNLYWKFHKTSPLVDIHPVAKEILQQAGVKVFYTGINNRAGNNSKDCLYEAVNADKVLLPCQDFHHNILLPNGDVALCHMDWSLQHILGNLPQQDYQSLYSGSAFRQLLVGLEDTRSGILCRQCEKDIVKRGFFEKAFFSISKRLKGKKDIY